jgi:2'-5' RNA ligase
MYFALVHFPDIDTTCIEILRNKNDPTAHLIQAHISILFPVPDEIDVDALIYHIESVLKHWKPFPIRINGLHKSWDNWLFLTLKDGNAEVIRLHNQIYTGMLRLYQREDIDFVPHIGLGLFVKEGLEYDYKNPKEMEFDESKYELAVHDANQLDLDYRCMFDKLYLVTLTNDFSKIEVNREFLLGEGSPALG